MSADKTAVVIDEIQSGRKVLEGKVLCLPLGEQDEPESLCASYLISLANLDVHLPTEVRDDTSEVQLMDIDSADAVAIGLKDITEWISYRQGISDYLRILCGRTKCERRAVSRGIKRVTEWKSLWEDFATSPEIQMDDPKCPLILFDKKIRHMKIRYITQYTHNDGITRTVDMMSAADILLVALMTKWLRCFQTHQDFIKLTIPSLLDYVRANRALLKQINRDVFADATYRSTSAVDALLNSIWVDEDETAVQLDYRFRFTCRDLMSRAQKMEESISARRLTKASVASSVIKAAAASSQDDLSTEPDALAAICTALTGLLDWPEALGASTAESAEVASSAHSQEGFKSAVYPEVPIDLSASSFERFWEIMDLPKGREKRKREQIISLVNEAERLLCEGGLAVEFCSGGGYVGIPLAMRRPDATVILTDMNSVSLNFAKQRIKRLDLKNVFFKLCELSHIDQDITVIGRLSVGMSASYREFDLGLALHACGGASDSVLRICRDAGAAFVVSPCCYGFIKHSVLAALDVKPFDISMIDETASNCGRKILYPLSASFRNAGWNPMWFAQLCSQADRTFWIHDDRSVAHNTSGQLAMKVIDSDRLLIARECGFLVQAKYMTPVDASPKNHILVGAI